MIDYNVKDILSREKTGFGQYTFWNNMDTGVHDKKFKHLVMPLSITIIKADEKRGSAYVRGVGLGRCFIRCRPLSPCRLASPSCPNCFCCSCHKCMVRRFGWFQSTKPRALHKHQKPRICEYSMAFYSYWILVSHMTPPLNVVLVAVVPATLEAHPASARCRAPTQLRSIGCSGPTI